MSHLLLHPDPTASAASVPSAPSPAPRRGWVSLILIGMVGGVSSGLFAIGGGVLMVPLLMWQWGMDQRRATALALATIVPSGLIGSITYMAHGNVDFAAAAVVAIGATAGAVVGSRMLQHLPVVQLRWLFVGFVLTVALRLVVVPPVRTGHDVEWSVAVAVGYVVLGLVMGMASGLFGIGGGIIAVPLLVSFSAVSDLVAKGTSLLVSVPTSAVGTVSNRRADLVDFRTALALGFVATATSVPSVALAMVVPPRLSGLLLAALLFLVATQSIAKNLAARRLEARA